MVFPVIQLTFFKEHQPVKYPGLKSSAVVINIKIIVFHRLQASQCRVPAQAISRVNADIINGIRFQPRIRRDVLYLYGNIYQAFAYSTVYLQDQIIWAKIKIAVFFQVIVNPDPFVLIGFEIVKIPDLQQRFVFVLIDNIGQVAAVFWKSNAVDPVSRASQCGIDRLCPSVLHQGKPVTPDCR